MDPLHSDPISAIVHTCRESQQALADALVRCFGGRYRVAVGEPGLWSDGLPHGFDGPGLVVALEAAGTGLVVLVPGSLLPPDWPAAPSDDTDKRLHELAWGVSRAVLPPGIEADIAATVPADSLHAEAADAGPLPQAAVLTLEVVDELASTAEPTAVCLVWPVRNPPCPLVDASPAAARAARPDTHDEAGAPSRSVPAPAAHDTPRDRARRLLNLPVTVSVRLAEKRIELGQLMALSPGALITFNKSCEDLLDFYVNNRRYGRGEAIKIGEKFGIKINEVGTVEVRERRVLGG